MHSRVICKTQCTGGTERADDGCSGPMCGVGICKELEHTKERVCWLAEGMQNLGQGPKKGLDGGSIAKESKLGYQ